MIGAKEPVFTKGVNVTKRILSVLLIMMLAAIPVAAFAEDNGLIVNGGFEDPDTFDSTKPAGWLFDSYADTYDNRPEVSEACLEYDSARSGNVLMIENTEADDTAIFQTITVEPSSVYRLSCWIRTENVEGGAGANIALRGDLICRSEPVVGTTDWSYVELIGKTDILQSSITVSCRLGGYSATSKGKAWFDDFAVEKLEDYSGSNIVRFYSADVDDDASGDKGASPAKTILVILGIALGLVVVAAIVMIILRSISGKRNGGNGGDGSKTSHDDNKAGANTKSMSGKERAMDELAGRSYFDTRANSMPAPTDTRLHFKKLDWILVICLTAVYGVVALLNLGTTKSPESYYLSETPNESVRIDFDGSYVVSEIWNHTGICNDANYLIVNDSGETISHEIIYGEMYRWTKLKNSSNVVWGFNNSTTGVTITSQAGGTWINELVFFDENGEIIPCVASGAALALVDEQDTVPEHISYFNGMYFDELYHGRTAYEMLNNMDNLYETTHPPLGKLLISIGIAIFGMNPFGWRIIGALFGVAMVPIMYCFGKRLFKKTEYAFLTAFLMAFDFMHFTQTRIATIDVFGVFFIMLMTYFMYKFISMDIGDSTNKMLLPLALSGIFFGLGCASKWIGLYTGVALAIMFFSKLIIMGIKSYRLKHAKSEYHDLSARFWKRSCILCAWCLIFFIIVPIGIYCASYFRYYTGDWKPEAQEAIKREMAQSGEYTAEQLAEIDVEDIEIPFSEAVDIYLNGVWNNQTYMLNYHSGTGMNHNAASVWWEWVLNLRPTWFYVGYDTPGENNVSTISTFGNPAVWLACFVGTVALVVMLIRKIKRIPTDVFMMFICMASSLLPWVFVTRSTYAYHYFATVPFIIMASVYALKYAEERRAIEAEYLDKPKKSVLPYVKWVWMAVVLLLFGLFYPVISGLPAPRDYVAALQWVPFFKFETANGRVIRIGWTFTSYEITYGG